MAIDEFTRCFAKMGSSTTSSGSIESCARRAARRGRSTGHLHSARIYYFAATLFSREVAALV